MLEYLNFLEESQQKEILELDPSNIQYINKPSISLQEFVIEKDPFNIQYIKKPWYEVVFKALALNGNVIEFIKNPSQKQIVIAKNQDLNSLKLLKKLPVNIYNFSIKTFSKLITDKLDYFCEDIQKELISKNIGFLNLIENPSKEIIEHSFWKDKNNFKYFNYKFNTSYEIQKQAVLFNGSFIHYIENPSEELQEIAINKDFHNIVYIKNPTRNILIKVAENSTELNKYPISKVQNLTEEIQEIAINTCAYNLSFIGPCSDNIKILALRNYYFKIKHINKIKSFILSNNIDFSLIVNTLLKKYDTEETLNALRLLDANDLTFCSLL